MRLQPFTQTGAIDEDSESCKEPKDSCIGRESAFCLPCSSLSCCPYTIYSDVLKESPIHYKYDILLYTIYQSRL